VGWGGVCSVCVTCVCVKSGGWVVKVKHAGGGGWKGRCVREAWCGREGTWQR